VTAELSINADACRLPRERSHYIELLAANPNHFGNLPDSKFPVVEKMLGNVRFEQLGCVGYNPVLDMLEATVAIKLPFGYGGNLCSQGSTEYLRFYVDYGSGWTDAGIGSFSAHDIPDGKDCADDSIKPLTYAVTIPYQPKRDRCSRPVLPKLRAILSWQTPPPAAQPNWSPVWGNVSEAYIQIAPRGRFFDELIKDAAIAVAPKFELPANLEYLQQIPAKLPLPPPPSIEQLSKLYSSEHCKTAATANDAIIVPPHRYALADIQTTLAGGFTSNAKIALAKTEQYKLVKLDWSAILAALNKTKGDVSYEELTCLALDYNLEWAVAHFVLKRPSGYNGSLCDHGSEEYVTFWIDYDNTCEWTYLDTVKLRVHDITPFPKEGLRYWVGVPTHLAEHRRSCKEAKIGRLRAVLSWNAPPSATNPDALPHWGNRLDSHFEVKPGKPVTLDAAIDVIGGIGLNYINVAGDGMTKPMAPFAQWGGTADEWIPTRQCAFGGFVQINAVVPQDFSAAGYKYRLMLRKASTGLGLTPLLGSFTVTQSLALGGLLTTRTPVSPDGWLDYLHPNQNIFSVLGQWDTAALAALDRNDKWQICLELASAALVPIGATPWYNIQLDNQSPEVNIQIVTSSGLADCNDFDQGQAVTGRFVAYDPQGHFGYWSLDTTPNSLNPRDPVADPAGLPNTTPTAVLGYGWRMDTSTNSLGQPLQPCGYVVTVRAWDNTIVNSFPGIHNRNDDDSGFCLRKKA
jgi:hypothetical protein